MNEYEARQEARRERLLNAAARADREAESRFQAGQRMFDAIPLGQPILVGHHSEKRDRSYRNRAANHLDKGLEAQQRAAELRAKADGVGRGGISSDDPEAVEKLRERVAELEGQQQLMKAANKVVRKFAKARLTGPDSTSMACYLEKIREVYAGISDGAAMKLLEPDYCGRIGFPDYALTNNNANLRRLKQRLAALEQRAKVRESLAAEGVESREETIGDVRVVENVEANRLQVFFPAKPSAEVRARLKSNGFRWSPTEGAWQRQLTSGAKYAARYVLQGQA